MIHARRESWGWRDRRTGTPVSITSTFSREQAESQLAEWKARDRRGKRPDLHDLMPHVEVYRIHPEEGSTDVDPGPWDYVGETTEVTDEAAAAVVEALDEYFGHHEPCDGSCDLTDAHICDVATFLTPRLRAALHQTKKRHAD